MRSVLSEDAAYQLIMGSALATKDGAHTSDQSVHMRNVPSKMTAQWKVDQNVLRWYARDQQRPSCGDSSNLLLNSTSPHAAEALANSLSTISLQQDWLRQVICSKCKVQNASTHTSWKTMPAAVCWHCVYTHSVIEIK